MDRYKFRGKELSSDMFVYGDLTITDDGVVFITQWEKGSLGYWNKNYEVDPSTVGQYTGLKYYLQDKESYEGDIVEYAGKLYIVKWDLTEAEYFLESVESEHDEYCGQCIEDSTFKGTIHDNPSLLKGE